MRTNHPEATAVDVEIFLEGWEMGAKWAVCSIRSPEHHTVDTEEQASGNVMRQLEALQASKRDLLNRLASQV